MTDLFAGAGGLSDGLSEAGFHSLFASEIVPVYADTYKKNHPASNESDWKLFRSKLPSWHEANMERMNREYAALLAGSGNAADKFWALEKRIHSD